MSHRPGATRSNDVERHYSTDGKCTPCGTRALFWCASEDRARVTCKRCLASLAKRDRAFQRKARRQFGFPKSRWLTPKDDAARAIAREEGRAL